MKMTFDLKRRLWLKQATAIALGTSIQPTLSFAKTKGNPEDVIYGGGRYQEVEGGPFKYVLSKIETATQTIKTSTAAFFPHGFALSENRHAYVFEKIGSGAGLVDLNTMEWLATIPPVNNRLFYGHGACSKDGKLLFSTETSPDERGAIGVRDLKSLDYLGDFPTYGSNPHDCHLIENGKVLLVTNGGGTLDSGVKASLCYIDAASQQLLERVEMPDERFNSGHVAYTRNRQAVLVSAPRKGWGTDHLGAISLNRQGRLKVLSKPDAVTQNMFGESLSVVAIRQKDMFIATHPTPGMVTIWQLSTGRLLKKLNLPHARGVVLASDQRAVWISYHSKARLIRVNLHTLMPEQHSELTNTFISGSHIFSGKNS